MKKVKLSEVLKPDLKKLDELSLNPVFKLEIEDISNQIIQLVDPNFIYLFGSSIKNEMNLDSDIDWMIVLNDTITNRRKISQYLYKNIKRINHPCDFIVTNSVLLEKQKSNIGLIYYYILKEGKCIYAK